MGGLTNLDYGLGDSPSGKAFSGGAVSYEGLSVGAASGFIFWDAFPMINQNSFLLKKL